MEISKINESLEKFVEEQKTFKDGLGREIKIGDIIYQYSTYNGYGREVLGKVIAFVENGIRIQKKDSERSSIIKSPSSYVILDTRGINL